jgi:hypothetical protein
MRPIAPYPSYYCPPGIERPKHCAFVAPARLVEGVGPDADGGGLYYGAAPYDPLTKDQWFPTKQLDDGTGGWWVYFLGDDPSFLARLRLMDGPVVVNGGGICSWIVPQLLRWHPASKLASAVPEVFRNYEWQPPEHLANLMVKLKAMLLFGMVEGMPIIEDKEAIALAVDILALNYHISLHELTLKGWLTEDLVSKVIEAAGGVVEMRGLREAGNGG